MTSGFSSLPNRRVSTPSVIQMEMAECGAAALGIILGYHGKVVPLAELREACGVSRDGSRASNILKAARQYGLEAKGVRCEVNRLAELPLPAVLFWSFNHFVVLEGFGKSGSVFYINDPALGRQRLSAEEFDGNYTGGALTFEQGPEFQRGGENPGTRTLLWKFLRGSPAAGLFGLACALLFLVPGLLAPAFARVFVDDCLIAGEKAWLGPLLVAMGLTVVFQIVLSAVQQSFLVRLRSALSLVGSGRFLSHVLRLPVSYFSQRFSGEIGSRVVLNEDVADAIEAKVATGVFDLVIVVFLGIAMFFYDGVLAAIAIASALASLSVLRYITRASGDRNRVVARDAGKLLATSLNGVSIIEHLKGGGEDAFFSRWAGFQAATLAGKQSVLAWTEVMSLAPVLLEAVSYVLILVIGAFQVMDSRLSVGTLIAFQLLVLQVNRPVGSLLRFGSGLQTLAANLHRIEDVLQAEEDPVYRGAADSPAFEGTGKLSGRVELRNVTFGYSPLEPPLVENLSFVLKPGHRVAIVGRSGSGKSTVARLVAGLYQPWSGEILFDGHPAAGIPRDVFAGSLSMVDQDIVLFNASVKDNLRLWDPALPDEAVTNAAKDAEIAGDITSRPLGYQNMLDEGGLNFSGGQRQRLEIARSLARDPSILILDEATSALDAVTEEMIDRNIRRRGCSCLIVAHRLSTIRDADEILVIDEGKVVERGRFEELMNRDGIFKTLVSD